MQDEPTPTELIKAVADFLRNEITPVIKGHSAFKLRVGINASIWWRASSRSNLTAMPRKPAAFQDCSACRARSANSIARSPIASPRARLICERLASPIICGRPRMAKLAVDQPNYASYKRELGGK